MVCVCGMKRKHIIILKYQIFKEFFNISSVPLKKISEDPVVLYGVNCISCSDSPFSNVAMYLYGSWP